MAKKQQSLRTRVSQATGRRRKKPTNPIQRAFEDVKQLVSGTGGGLFGRSGQRKAATKPASAKKTAATRRRAGQQQAEAKKGAASRIQQRRAAPKKGGHTRAKAS